MPQSKKLNGQKEGQIAIALARAELYRWISLGLRYPDDSTQALLREKVSVRQLQDTCKQMDQVEQNQLSALVKHWTDSLEQQDADVLTLGYIQTFGHIAQSQVPLYETEYGQAQSLMGLHELADIAGFYRAFGLEITPSLGERVDHVSVESIFLHFLCYKEAYALTHHGTEQVMLCRDTQKQFLKNHFGAWGPSMALRILENASDSIYGSLAQWLLKFLNSETKRFDLPPTSEQLGLRAPDPSLEEGCTSCSAETSCPGGADALAVRSESD